jgi:WD40 repeat protein
MDSEIENLKQTVNSLAKDLNDSKNEILFLKQENNNLNQKISILEKNVFDLKNGMNSNINNILLNSFNQIINSLKSNNPSNLYNTNASNNEDNSNKYKEFENPNRNLIIFQNKNTYIQKVISNFNIWKQNDISYDLILDKLNMLKTIDNHNKKYVYSIAQLNDNRLVSCGEEYDYINIYNSETFELEEKIKLPCKFSYYLKPLDLNYLSICLDNGEINIYELNFYDFKFYYKYSLKGHKEGVNKLLETKNKKTLISISNDKTIKFWNLNEKNEYILDNNYIEDEYKIENIVFINDDETEVVVCYNFFKNNCISFYDIIKKQKIKTIEGIKATNFSNQNLLKIDNYLLIGSKNKNGEIIIINLDKKEIEKTFIDNNKELGYIYCFLLLSSSNNKTKRILCGDWNGNLIEYKLILNKDKNDEKKIDLEFVSIKPKVHNDLIRSIIKYNNDKIVTCSIDGTIKIFQ